jgi:hypothetical protein
MKTHGCVSKVIDSRSVGNPGGTGYYSTSFIFAYIIGIGNRVSVDKWVTVDMRMAYGVGKSWISFSRSLSNMAIIGISIPIYPFGLIAWISIISWISIITIPGISGSLGFGLRLSHNGGYSESYDKLEWD